MLSSAATITPLTPLPDKEVAKYKEEIDKIYNDLLLKRGFNGSILIAKNGTVLMEDYRGFVNLQTKEPITESTTFHLASISKTFTAMVVLKLWEQGRLSLDDTLQKYFPEFPLHNINIRMLLSHRSGLTNYPYLMDTAYRRMHKLATNDDVISFFIQRKPLPAFRAGARYQYSNTNFAILASIVERVTGQPFPQYMKDSVFTPLGMTHTFVFSIKDTASYVPTYASERRIYPLDVMDCTYGDKNVYSTTRDLLQWDKALYENRLVSKATYDSAVVPRSNEHKTMHNYGYGWHLYTDKTDTIVYHNGYWHGNNTVFTRLVEDTATVIVLSNKLNRTVYQAKKFAVVFKHYKKDVELEE